jgi:hypothetical protein
LTGVCDDELRNFAGPSCVVGWLRVRVVTPRCGSATGLGFNFAWSERGLSGRLVCAVWKAKRTCFNAERGLLPLLMIVISCPLIWVV